MSFDNGKWWPAAYRPRETWTHAYRTMQEAGLEPFEDDDSKTWMDVFAIGFGIGLLIGLGLIDFVEAMV